MRVTDVYGWGGGGGGTGENNSQQQGANASVAHDDAAEESALQRRRRQRHKEKNRELEARYPTSHSQLDGPDFENKYVMRLLKRAKSKYVLGGLRPGMSDTARCLLRQALIRFFGKGSNLVRQEIFGNGQAAVAFQIE